MIMRIVENVATEYMMRSGSADARLSKIWGISLLPYSIELFVTIITTQSKENENRLNSRFIAMEKVES